MSFLAVAAVSARVLAEAALREGFDVIALDLFGDVDTCRAVARWFSIGAAGSLQIDPAQVLAALGALARRGDVAGWIAGSGFEAWPDLLEEGHALLPLIGCTPTAVRRVRDPKAFFGALARLGIPAPAVRSELPTDASGWLVKDARGLGGWHVRRALPAGEAALPAQHYAQREVRGVPMSATFVGNGADAVVLGFNEMIVRPIGNRPFVYCGVIGPVPLAADLAARVTAAVREIAAAFDLKGLASLDFMLDGDRFQVLEVNPRPPASMALYAGLSLIEAHLHACRDGVLLPMPSASTRIEGTEIVFARRPFVLAETLAQRLADAPHVHDLPCAGARFDAGDPVCSLEASGDDAGQVRARLAEGRETLLRTLESLS